MGRLSGKRRDAAVTTIYPGPVEGVCQLKTRRVRDGLLVAVVKDVLDDRLAVSVAWCRAQAKKSGCKVSPEPVLGERVIDEMTRQVLREPCDGGVRIRILIDGEVWIPAGGEPVVPPELVDGAILMLSIAWEGQHVGEVTR